MKINFNPLSVVSPITRDAGQSKRRNGMEDAPQVIKVGSPLEQVSFYQSIPAGIVGANLTPVEDSSKTKFDTTSYTQYTSSYLGSAENMSTLNSLNKNDIALLESMGAEFSVHSSGALEINPPELRSLANGLADARYMTTMPGYNAPNESYASFAAGGQADASVLRNINARILQESENVLLQTNVSRKHNA